MTLTVTIYLADQSTLEGGVALDLLNGGSLITTATTDAQGMVTFGVDAAALTAAAIRVSAQQPTVAN